MQRQTSDSTDSESVDYAALDLPDKPRTEWHYTHRRAELLQLIREAGHPDDLNQTELAEKYDVCQQQISKDLERIGQAVRDRIASPDRHILMVESVLNRSVRGLLNEGEYRDAAKTALEYDDWIQDRIEAAEFRDRLDRLEDAVGDGGQHG